MKLRRLAAVSAVSIALVGSSAPAFAATKKHTTKKHATKKHATKATDTTVKAAH